MKRRERNPLHCQTTQHDHIQRHGAQDLWIITLERHPRLTRSLPLLGSDVDWQCCLLTTGSQAKRVKRHQKQNETAPGQNRGAVATGSIWDATQASFSLRPCAPTSV